MAKKTENDAPVELRRNGKLTRAGMEAVIKDGGSVLHNGKLLRRIEDLPNEAELVKGDAEAEKATSDSLQRQIDALQAQLNTLVKKPATKPEKPEGGSEPK